mgnify:FL=1
MVKYLKFCGKLQINPNRGSSLQLYKKHLKLGIPLKYADKKHFIQAYQVNYKLLKSINYEN